MLTSISRDVSLTVVVQVVMEVHPLLHQLDSLLAGQEVRGRLSPGAGGGISPGMRDGSSHVLRCLKVWYDLPSDVFHTAVSNIDTFLAKMKVNTRAGMLAWPTSYCEYPASFWHQFKYNKAKKICSRCLAEMNKNNPLDSNRTNFFLLFFKYILILYAMQIFFLTSYNFSCLYFHLSLHAMSCHRAAAVHCSALCGPENKML